MKKKEESALDRDVRRVLENGRIVFLPLVPPERPWTREEGRQRARQWWRDHWWIVLIVLLLGGLGEYFRYYGN